MPDVGVLELQIRDNADQAGGGLENLADAISMGKNSGWKGSWAWYSCNAGNKTCFYY